MEFRTFAPDIYTDQKVNQRTEVTFDPDTEQGLMRAVKEAAGDPLNRILYQDRNLFPSTTHGLILRGIVRAEHIALALAEQRQVQSRRKLWINVPVREEYL